MMLNLLILLLSVASYEMISVLLLDLGVYYGRGLFYSGWGMQLSIFQLLAYERQILLASHQ